MTVILLAVLLPVLLATLGGGVDSSSGDNLNILSYINNFGVNGTSLLDLRTGRTLFLKGVGYSPFLPGETPIWGGNLPNDNRYFNHLNIIKNLNVNFLLVFPQFMPENFFVALDNTGLIYAQDIYINGETDDLLDENFQNTSIEHIKKVIDHTYSVGRTDKLVFFSIGDEINAGTIYATDTRHPDKRNFVGNFITLSDRTPSEVAIAKLMDEAITYEYAHYGVKHLYTHTSWTHIGPVARPDLEVSQNSIFFADFGDIICMNIYTYARGVVTSPPGSVTGTSYQGYIEDLVRILQKPGIITQVGLSTSPVAPNPDIPDYGGNSYEKVESVYSQVWEDVKTATGSEKINGLVWFEFMDEWWKTGMESHDESSHNDQDPEEWFGIYSVNDDYSLSPKGDIPEIIRVFFSSGVVFNDVPEGYWAENYINTIYYNSITTGCVQDDPTTPQNERQYCPENSVTRGQMAAFIIRAKYGESFNYTTTPYITDVPSTHTFFKYVQKLKDDGITAVSGTYGVDNEVTRGQMAAFIIRAKYGENFTYTQTPYFTDVPSTHGFFKYVQKLKDDGITTVTVTYGVDNIVTRAQMAAFLARAFLGME